MRDTSNSHKKLEEIHSHIDSLIYDREKPTLNKVNTHRFHTQKGDHILHQRDQPHSKASSVKTEDTNLNRSTSTQTCDMCNTSIVLEDNLSGLIIDDTYVVCESCCKNTSRNDLMQWTNEKMSDKFNYRPIGLWLADKQNKETTSFFKW